MTNGSVMCHDQCGVNQPWPAVELCLSCASLALASFMSGPDGNQCHSFVPLLRASYTSVSYSSGVPACIKSARRKRMVIVLRVDNHGARSGSTLGYFPQSGPSQEGTLPGGQPDITTGVLMRPARADWRGRNYLVPSWRIHSEVCTLYLLRTLSIVYSKT